MKQRVVLLRWGDMKLHLQLTIIACFIVSNFSVQAQSAPEGFLSSKLLGGSYADLASGAVSLIVGQNQTKAWLCTGALVSPTVVLTAAHCIADGGAFTIYVGRTKQNARAGYLHGGYNPGAPISFDQVSKDIAVLILSSPVTKVAPIPILSGLPTRIGDAVSVYGFGTNEQKQSPKYDPYANGKWAPLKVADAKTGVFASSTATSGASSCPGDSGGPVLKQVGNVLTVVGIVSAGTNQTAKDSQSVLRNGGITYYNDVQGPNAEAFLAQIPGGVTRLRQNITPPRNPRRPPSNRR
jgi:hypothetical protein